MNLKIKNFGKIAEADVRLDGITVICGNNNTGKSTVGKALFSFFNSLCDYKTKIAEQKCVEIRSFAIKNMGVFTDFPAQFLSDENIMRSLPLRENNISFEDIQRFFESQLSLNIKKDKVETLLVKLNADGKEILNEYVFRTFSNHMNGQIKRADSGRQKCVIIAEFRNGTNTIAFSKNKCICSQGEIISHNAYYINSPFLLDSLNSAYAPLVLLNPMERAVIDEIIEAQNALNKNSMSNIFDSVINKKDIEEIINIIKKAYKGDTKLEKGKYYYCENGVDFDIRNISAGLKSFALIERMLETGVLKRKDVLILDEPEIHLHSEWQIIYAEMIVLLQKQFDLTILIVTHSFQFLESLNFFMKKYGISDKGSYYIPEETDKGIVMKSCRNDNLWELKQGLKSGMYTLADLQLDEINDGDSDEEDNE